MIRPATYYEAFCDGCGKRYDEGDFSAWADQSAAHDYAVDDGGWSHNDGIQHWCPECQHCPREEHIRDEEDVCKRCGLELEALEDHTG